MTKSDYNCKTTSRELLSHSRLLVGKNENYDLRHLEFVVQKYSLDICCISHIALRMTNVCIFSNDHITHDLTVVLFSLDNSKRATQ